MCGEGSSRTTDTARATSTAEIGEVLPPPIGSASSSASRTPGAAKSRKNPSRKTVGRMITTGRPDQEDFTLSRATPSAASEHLLELIGFPISRSFTTYCVCLELRSLPSTGVTRLQRYYEPLR